MSVKTQTIGTLIESNVYLSVKMAEMVPLYAKSKIIFVTLKVSVNTKGGRSKRELRFHRE